MVNKEVQRETFVTVIPVVFHFQS